MLERSEGMDVQNSQPQIGYILRSYPRLSQTFILHEILALERLGLKLDIFAITNPREELTQAEVTRVRAPVPYLEGAARRASPVIALEHLGFLLKSPARYLSALGYVLRHGEIDKGYTASSRFECFLQAVYLAHLLRMRDDHLHDRAIRDRYSAIKHLHAHFAHDPTLIAMLAHMLTGIPYSFTAHARDLYQVPEQELTRRVARASAVVTCCAANVEYLSRVLPERLRRKVHLIHHGVDLRNFH